MFVLVCGRHVGALTDGNQHGVSIQISINLEKEFLRISRIRNIAVTRILVRVFAYLPSFISQIHDFIYWLVVIFILIYFELPDSENQQLHVHEGAYVIQEFSQHLTLRGFLFTFSFLQLLIWNSSAQYDWNMYLTWK